MVEDTRTRMADPGAWAVTAFATTSFMLGMYNAGLLPKDGEAVVLPVAFFFGGLIQIIVGILEAMRGNLFGTVVFGTYGPFWVILASILTWWKVPGSAISLFLAMFAVVSFYFFLASLKTDKVLVVIFALIVIALVVLSVGAGSGLHIFTVAGGWLTLAFAVLAWYHAAADMINFTFGRTVCNVGPIKK
jgi:succinate-acetate transporter protein